MRDHLGIPLTVKPVVYNRASDERDLNRRTSEQVAVANPVVGGAGGSGSNSNGTSPNNPLFALPGLHVPGQAVLAPTAVVAGGAAPAHFSTCFYGRQGIIVEVMKNDLIETVILY